MPHPELGPDTVGSLAWLRRTEGRVSLGERLTLMGNALRPRFMHDLVASQWGSAHANAPRELAPLLARLPDTPAVAQALQAMAATGHDAVLQHSWRTHWWADAFAVAEGHEVDRELLLVASLTHDLGIADAPGHAASGCACFTGHSAQVAMGIARDAAWPAARVQALGEAITLHMNGRVPLDQGREAHLLQRATACDVIGAQLTRLPASLRQAVLSRHPRGDFDAQFAAFLAQQRRQHPHSRAAVMAQLGVPWLVRFNPF